MRGQPDLAGCRELTNTERQSKEGRSEALPANAHPTQVGKLSAGCFTDPLKIMR